MILPASSRPPGPTAIPLPQKASLWRYRNNDFACGFILGVDARNHDPVVKRRETSSQSPYEAVHVGGLSDDKRSPRSQRNSVTLLLIGVLLALVKCDCQPVVGDLAVMLLTPWIRTKLIFDECVKQSSDHKPPGRSGDSCDRQDFEKPGRESGLTRVNTAKLVPLIRYRFFFFSLSGRIGMRSR